MKTYAERSCFSEAHLRLRARVEAYIARVSGAWGNELRCHELARAVHHVFRALSPGEIVVVDGHCGPIEHSWLCCSDGGVILDVYAPGRLPSVQLVDPFVGTGYRPGAPRQDIRQRIVDQLVVEMRVS